MSRQQIQKQTHPPLSTPAPYLALFTLKNMKWDFLFFIKTLPPPPNFILKMLEIASNARKHEMRFNQGLNSGEVVWK